MRNRAQANTTQMDKDIQEDPVLNLNSRPEKWF